MYLRCMNVVATSKTKLFSDNNQRKLNLFDITTGCKHAKYILKIYLPMFEVVQIE